MATDEENLSIAEEIRMIVTGNNPVTREEIGMALSAVAAAMDAVTASHSFLISEDGSAEEKKHSSEYISSVKEFYSIIKDTIRHFEKSKVD